MIVSQVNISCVWMQIIYMVGQYRHFPYIEFKWLNQEEIDKYDVNLIAENNLHGHTLEIDLEYPDTLHELHNDSPLAPEKHEISHMLSKYCSSIANKYDIKIGAVNKLVPNLCNKNKCSSLQKSSAVFVISNEID